MKFVHKTLGLLLASLALSSCGGGGGDGHGAFESPQSGHITLTTSGGTTTLPLNTSTSPWFSGSPYTVEVDIHWTNADGTPVSGHDLSCSITPLSVASIHILDDASTPDDESAVDWGNIQVHSDTGHAVCWVFARQLGNSGTATLTVGGVDPVTNATVSSSLVFTVQNASGPLPASITMNAAPTGVYLSGSGGSQNSVLSIQVLDGGSQPVPDPANGNSGFDNVQLDIVSPDNGNAQLSANSVSGPVTGQSVKTHTVNGIATASFQAGSVEGPIQIRATSDRSDNNVSNGITDPVSTTQSVIVSDGKLYSLQITSPNTNAILVNQVDPSVEVDGDSNIPPNPDATYSLTVSALGTDRQGNPVLPGTPIRFGSIDEPVGSFDAGDLANRFLIADGYINPDPADGDPTEGGNTFVSPSGQFRTAGGGAGPGDVLIVFGKTEHGAPEGNEDLESALTVQQVNSQTTLTTTSNFNRNDTTGVLVDHGPVLPYIVGRSRHGNISTNQVTNEIGVAHTTLNYTASTLGHIVAMWAQGDGIDRITDGPRRVTDATELVYPGVAPASLTAFPSPIPGNQAAIDVTVCLTDALASPIQGVAIGFQFQLTGGTGSVDGVTGSGTLANVTGPNGCAVASVTTSGVPASSADGGVSGTLVFSVGDATASVDIVVQLAFLQASPTAICPGSSVSIKAVTTTGAPASGVSITGTCTNGLTVSPATAQTGPNGVAVFQVSGDLPSTPTQCTFTASDFGQSVSVNVGFSGGSPPCAASP